MVQFLLMVLEVKNLGSILALYRMTVRLIHVIVWKGHASHTQDFIKYSSNEMTATSNAIVN